MDKTASILVVDDDHSILEIYAEVLRAEGYEVWEASTGKQGLAVVREKRPDLVLLDVLLPDLSGIEVCRQIKADPALADVFIVLISGSATSVAHKVGGLQNGADEYLVKTVEADEFLARVRTLVRLRNATAALRAAEQYHRRLMESLPEAVGVIDLQGRLLAVNPQGVAMLGYASPVELLGKSAFDFTLPEDRTRFQGDLAATLETGVMRNAEYTLLKKNGERFLAETSAVVSADASGQPSGMVIVLRDTTERKWFENLLQVQRDFGSFLSSANALEAASEQLLKVVLENEGLDCGAVYLVNPETNALELTRHVGLSDDFATGTSRSTANPVLHPVAGARPAFSREQVGPMAAIVQQLKSEGLLALEAIPIQHRGQVVAVLNVGSRTNPSIPAKTRQAIEALATQAGGAIARIRAEQSLRASQQLLQQTIQSLHAAVFFIDAHTATIQDCNPAATRIFGHTREEMIGQRPNLLHRNNARWEGFQRHLQAAINEKGRLSEFEFEMKRKDGSSFPCEHNVVPIRNDQGDILTWVGVVRDIAERKRYEADLRRLSGRIIAAQETERQRVARDLHDSVNQVIASAKMRLRKVEASAALNPVAREQLARCDELLVQALDENRRIAHDLRPPDLDELGLPDACRNFCRQFQARTNLVVKARLARFGHRCPPATELHLFRIVQEAFNNVEKHARARTVRLQIAVQRGGLMLRIQDDGCGFDPNAAQPARRNREGIGLTNMRERAAILRGTCEVESAPTHGTTITVRVPLPSAP